MVKIGSNFTLGSLNHTGKNFHAVRYGMRFEPAQISSCPSPKSLAFYLGAGFFLLCLKFWLILNLAITLVLCAALACYAPRGNTFTLIKVTTTNAGCTTELLTYWQPVTG
jgi:hypothetical protein